VFRRCLSLVIVAGFLVTLAGVAHAASLNGSGGDMPALYDGRQFTINFKLLKPDMHNNPSFNTIYQCDSCANQGLQFVSVLDAIQGDGFNPIWRRSRSTSRPVSRRCSTRQTRRSSRQRLRGRSPSPTRMSSTAAL